MNSSLRVLAVTAAMAVTLLAPSSASAVNSKVASACVGDYLSYCSDHSPDSPGVRKCFRTNGASLSSKCVNALISAGEVSRDEVARKSTRR
jgi:hypothetical protein